MLIFTRPLPVAVIPLQYRGNPITCLHNYLTPSGKPCFPIMPGRQEQHVKSVICPVTLTSLTCPSHLLRPINIGLVRDAGDVRDVSDVSEKFITHALFLILN